MRGGGCSREEAARPSHKPCSICTGVPGALAAILPGTSPQSSGQTAFTSISTRPLQRMRTGQKGPRAPRQQRPLSTRSFSEAWSREAMQLMTGNINGNAEKVARTLSHSFVNTAFQTKEEEVEGLWGDGRWPPGSPSGPAEAGGAEHPLAKGPQAGRGPADPQDGKLLRREASRGAAAPKASFPRAL